MRRFGPRPEEFFGGILPSVNPGVIIHLHDIFPAFEYPQPWVEEGRGWTELYVLRAFEDPDVVHVEGHIDPVADIEVVETELMLADLDSLERQRGPVGVED